jgi:hypothetical protein
MGRKLAELVICSSMGWTNPTCVLVYFQSLLAEDDRVGMVKMSVRLSPGGGRSRMSGIMSGAIMAAT